MKAAAFVVMAVCTLVTSSFAPAQDEPLTLVGWGVASKELDTFMAQAADVCCDARITGTLDPEFLALAVEAGNQPVALACRSARSSRSKRWITGSSPFA